MTTSTTAAVALECRGESQPDLCYIDTVSSDVLEHHIFHYFWFNHWVTTFAAVCKRWKRICEHSKMAPKHIVLSQNKEFDIFKAIQIVAKYQPTILEIKCKPRSVPNFAFSKMISASKNLNTLILHHKDYMHPEYYDTDTDRIDLANQITTLVLCYKSFDRKDGVYAKQFELNEVEGFLPRLKRLHVQCVAYEHSKDISVEENYRELYYFEKYSPSGWERVITEKMADTLSYEQYFRYFGETKLYAALKKNDFAKAAVLLDTQTSIAYEEYLHRYLSYKFPTSLKYDRKFNVIDQYEQCLIHGRICKEEAFELLIATNKLEVSPSFKFLCLYQYGRMMDAVEVLKTMDPQAKISRLVQEAFMKMLLLPWITVDILTHPSIINVARRIVGEHDYISKCLTCDYQFEKIAFLCDDWSTVIANYQNESLFWSMIRHGCRPSMTDLVQAENGKDILTKLGYDFQSVLFEVLVKSNATLMSKLMEQHKVTPAFENKSGRSLFNALIRRGCDNFSTDIYEQYINHIDSEGFTPLTTAISVEAFYVVKDLFVELGANPNIHRGDLASPLALLIINYDMDCIFNVMDLLLQYEADINAPCLFEQRMCSPLMIAVLKKRSVELIRLLIVLGARVEFEDETGRSVLDCAKFNSPEVVQMIEKSSDLSKSTNYL